MLFCPSRFMRCRWEIVILPCIGVPVQKDPVLPRSFKTRRPVWAEIKLGRARALMTIARLARTLDSLPFDLWLTASFGFVEGHRGANESLQGLFVDIVAFVEVDGAPRISLEARVEKARRIFQGRALGERHFHDVLVSLAGADQSVVRPHRNASPLPLLDDFGIGLFDQATQPAEHRAPPIAEPLDPRVYQTRRRLALLRSAFRHARFSFLTGMRTGYRACFNMFFRFPRRSLRGFLSNGSSKRLNNGASFVTSLRWAKLNLANIRSAPLVRSIKTWRRSCGFCRRSTNPLAMSRSMSSTALLCRMPRRSARMPMVMSPPGVPLIASSA